MFSLSVLLESCNEIVRRLKLEQALNPDRREPLTTGRKQR